MYDKVQQFQSLSYANATSNQMEADSTAQKSREAMRQVAGGERSHFPVAETFFNLFTDVGQFKQLTRNTS